MMKGKGYSSDDEQRWDYIADGCTTQSILLPPKKKKKPQPQVEEDDFDDDEEEEDNQSQISTGKDNEKKYFSIPDDADICDLRNDSKYDVVPCFNRISTNNYVSIGMCEGFNEKTKGKFFSRLIFPFWLLLLNRYTKEKFFFFQSVFIPILIFAPFLQKPTPSRPSTSAPRRS